MKLPYNILLALVVLPILGWAQAPEGMNYQAVARDAIGEPLANQAITVVFEIRQGSASGTDVYKETQSLSTNQFGLFTAQIGAGTVLGGAFNTISWGTDSYYLYVEIDGDPMGSSQLLSVPYALYSKQSANGPTGPQGPPGISINWLGTFAAAPGSPNLNDAYYDSALGQSFIWDGANWNIIAQDGTSGAFTAGPGISIISGVISNIGDLDSLNELQTITRTGGMITLSDGGGSVIDSVIDADADPNNERITTFALNATNDSIIIVEAGVGHAFPLSNLNDGDWTRGVGNDIFNNADSVGIGTINPKSPLQIGPFMHSFPFTMPGPENYSVQSFNAHPNGGTIKNTIGGFSGITFIGHDNSSPQWGVQLYPTQVAGGDVMSVAPISLLHLKPIGLSIHKDTPEAALDIEPKDTAAVILRTTNAGVPSHLFFEDSQNFQVGLRSAQVMTGNYALTLPASLPSVTGSALVSDAVGNLSWAPAPNPIWSKTGTAIHQSILSDFVGIGTTIPATSFHVFNGPGTGGGAYNNIIDAIVEDNDYAYIEFNAGSFAGITFNDDAASIRAGVMFDYNIDALMFRTGGVDHRMILSEAGRLGIGTQTPVNQLDVAGNMAVGNAFAGSNAAPANSLIVEGSIGIGTDAPDQTSFEVVKPNGFLAYTCTNTNTPYGVRLAHPSASVSPTATWFLLVNPAGSNTNDMTIYKGNGTNTGYQMYFDEGNRVGVFTNAPTNSLSVNGSANKPGGGSWGVFSDRRLKQNVVNYDEGLDLILNVNPVSFQYNETYFTLFGESKEVRNKTYQGVIAQDVNKIAPDMVTSHHVIGKDEDGNVKGEQTILEVDPNKFTYALINAVKEQQKMIEDLLKKQQLLEEEILKLKNQ